MSLAINLNDTQDVLASKFKHSELKRVKRLCNQALTRLRVGKPLPPEVVNGLNEVFGSVPTVEVLETVRENAIGARRLIREESPEKRAEKRAEQQAAFAAAAAAVSVPMLVPLDLFSAEPVAELVAEPVAEPELVGPVVKAKRTRKKKPVELVATSAAVPSPVKYQRKKKTEKKK